MTDRHEQLTDRELLLLILERNIAMALDLTALNTAVSNLNTDVQKLIADVTPQSAIDAVTAAVTAIDTAVTTALAPPAPPAA